MLYTSRTILYSIYSSPLQNVEYRLITEYSFSFSVFLPKVKIIYTQ